jgi:hypothetical protein
VQEQTAGMAEARFADVRHARLKGLAGQYSLHPVAWAEV